MLWFICYYRNERTGENENFTPHERSLLYGYIIVRQWLLFFILELNHRVQFLGPGVEPCSNRISKLNCFINKWIYIYIYIKTNNHYYMLAQNPSPPPPPPLPNCDNAH